MSQFIPYNEQAATELSTRLSTTLFKNVENFVNFYNSGMIAKNSDEVVELVKQVVETYKNVEEKSKQLVFLSTSEVYLEESLNLLQAWVPIVKIKREVTEAKENNLINDDSIIAFNKKEKVGNTLTITRKGDENVLTAIGNERVFTKVSQIEQIFKTLSSVQEENDQCYYFKAKDFLNVNDSFITTIHESIPQI